MCLLSLELGDSAKALAVAGRAVVGCDKWGIFPLKGMQTLHSDANIAASPCIQCVAYLVLILFSVYCVVIIAGKPINASKSTHKTVLANAEVKALMQILGLEYGVEYTDVSQLRYSGIMVMADQDVDGSHIKGLVINLFARLWPSLLKLDGFMSEFITPIVKVSRLKLSKVEPIAFYTIAEYLEWKQERETDGTLNRWKIKYFKGLGTSTSLEGRGYFAAIDQHRITFTFEEKADFDALDMVFGKDTSSSVKNQYSNARKKWLEKYDPDHYIDHKKLVAERYKGAMFVNEELIVFSVASNLRAIPSIMDGESTFKLKHMHTWLLFVQISCVRIS